MAQIGVAEQQVPQKEQKRPELKTVTPEQEAEALLEKGPEALSESVETFSKEVVSGIRKISELLPEDIAVAPEEAKELAASTEATTKEIESAHDAFDTETEAALANWRKSQMEKSLPVPAEVQAVAPLEKEEPIPLTEKIEPIPLTQVKAIGIEHLPKDETMEVEHFERSTTEVPAGREGIEEMPLPEKVAGLEMDYIQEARSMNLELLVSAVGDAQKMLAESTKAAEEAFEAAKAYGQEMQTRKDAEGKPPALENYYFSYLDRRQNELRAQAEYQKKKLERLEMLQAIVDADAMTKQMEEAEQKLEQQRAAKKASLDQALTELRPKAAEFQKLEAKKLKEQPMTTEESDTLERLRKEIPGLQKGQLALREEVRQAELGMEEVHGKKAAAEKTIQEANVALNRLDLDLKEAAANAEVATKEREHTEEGYRKEYEKAMTEAPAETSAEKPAEATTESSGAMEAAVAAATAAGAALSAGAESGGKAKESVTDAKPSDGRILTRLKSIANKGKAAGASGGKFGAYIFLSPLALGAVYAAVGFKKAYNKLTSWILGKEGEEFVGMFKGDNKG
jgi:hypothetical protein